MSLIVLVEALFLIKPLKPHLFAAISDDKIEFEVPPERFVSKKLTNKITQQLNDCLVLSSMALPDWCERLTKWCPMLFSYDLRSLYFNYTAYGTSRCVNKCSLIYYMYSV